MVLADGGDSVVVDSLLIVTPIVGFCNCFMFCCALLCVNSSFAIISTGNRAPVALLCSFPRVCLQFVIVVFPDDTHLLFLF